MEYAKEIVGFLQWIAGISCVVSILISIFKIVTEEDTRGTYIIRIKHSLIALVLIFTISIIINLVPTYFTNANIGIGKIDKNNKALMISDSVEDKDSQKREIVYIAGQKCVVTDVNQELFYKKNGDDITFTPFPFMAKNTGIKVDIIRKFSSSQGIFKGVDSQIVAYRVTTGHQNAQNQDISLNFYESIYYSKLADGNYKAVLMQNTTNKIWSQNIGDLIAYTKSNGETVRLKNFE